MHVIFILTPHRLGYGVSERVVLRLIPHLLRNSVKVSVIQPGSTLREYTYLGINFHEHPSIAFRSIKLEYIIHYVNSWRYSNKLLNKIFRESKEDTLVVTTRPINALFLAKSFTRTYPLVIYELNHYPWMEDLSCNYRGSMTRYLLTTVDRNFQLNLCKIVFKKTSAIIVVSNAIRTYVESAIPEAKGRIVTIYNPVDTSFFTPYVNKEKLYELKRMLGLEDKKILLHVGTDHLVLRKGLHYAIRCLTKLPRDVVLLVTGYRVVPQLNIHYWNYVKHLIDKYNLKSRVFFTGWVPYNQLPLYYNLGEILLYPSIQEGFGMPLAEAMACGRPIVAFDIPPINEIVENGKTGILAPLENYDRLADAVRIVLEDKNLWIYMSTNSRERALKEFSLNVITEKHLELYNRILQNFKHRSGSSIHETF